MADQIAQYIIERPAGIEAYPGLVRLVAYCRDLANGRDLPHRSLFRPSQVRWLFGHLYLMDVIDGGADYRCRLWGQFWETIYGLDSVGMLLSETERAGFAQTARAQYDAVVADRRIHFKTKRLAWPDATVLDYGRLTVPFAGDDGKVSLLLFAAQCDMPLEDIVFFKGSGKPVLSDRDGVEQLF